MTKNDYYYNVADDVRPGCWLYLIIGGRGTGKTYSALSACLDKKVCFAFVKRTNKDVEMLCSNEREQNFSPFNAINRDRGCSIQPHSILKDMIGGFWEEGQDGQPIGYILSMNALNTIKGFDFPQRIDVVIFDEFIPQPWERVNRKEGEQFMDLILTLSRDREHRGFPPMKVFCLANAVRLSNPLTNFFEVTDDFALMQMQGSKTKVIQERGFVLRLLQPSSEFKQKQEDSIIYQSMKETAWGSMAYENVFGYDDVSSVGRVSLKGFRPVVAVRYKKNEYFFYMKDGIYQACKSKTKACRMYNLNRENEQKAFYLDYALEFRTACIEDKMHFETYSMYDLIINYKKIFNV